LQARRPGASGKETARDDARSTSAPSQNLWQVRTGAVP
jgi:hypothetical protein